MSNNEGFVIGFPFDQLLNQSCPLEPSNSDNRGRGIVLPTADNPGSGNIVICGPPGSGKSTLAMQFAVMVAHRLENKSISAYISLENSPDEISAKLESFGWNKHLKQLKSYQNTSELAGNKDFADLLLWILTQPRNMNHNDSCPILEKVLTQKKTICRRHRELYDTIRNEIDTLGAIELYKDYKLSSINPCVLFPSLSPRPLNMNQSDDLFWMRYNQLEKILIAGDQLNNYLQQIRNIQGKNNEKHLLKHILKLIVIDSLNMFSMQQPTREEMFRLFSLFKKYKAIGIFVVESSQETPFDSTLADVVISLKMEKDKGYFIRYLEIEKSRFINQVYGQHPFRTTSLIYDKISKQPARTPPIPEKNSSNTEGDFSRHGIVVFPSLHYIVLRTGDLKVDNTLRDKKKSKDIIKYTDDENIWGINALKAIPPTNRIKGSVVTIMGPRGTFKTNLALSFLASGLNDGESSLLIHFHDSPLLDPSMQTNKKWPTISSELYNENKEYPWEKLIKVDDEETRRWQNIANEEKAQFIVWKYNNNKSHCVANLFEIDFKSGSLLPEEFVHIVRDVLIRRNIQNKIKRVVLDDISEIGAAYPFLRNSFTSGDIFLPAIAHLMRNHNINLVITGTMGDLESSNETVNRACEISDAVISCKYCDVFGKRHVILQGDGITGGKERHGTDSQNWTTTPPVIIEERIDGIPFFSVKSDYLEGLVGFDTGNVERPGLIMNLFEDTQGIHKEYNWRISNMVRAKLERGVVDKGIANYSGKFVHTPIDNISQYEYNPNNWDFSLRTFGSLESEAIHHSIRILGSSAPLDKTVLYTVDEFYNTLGKDTKSLFSEINDSELEVNQLIKKYKEEKTLKYVWPYYLNVLLIAYRNDIFQDKRKKSMWLEVDDLMSWKSMMEYYDKIKIDNNNQKAPINRKFWIDLTASETFSCSLMNIILGQYSENEKKEKMKNISSIKKLSKNQKDEIDAFCELLKNTEYSKLTIEDKAIYNSKMPNDAAIYVCWYSQLRELIKENPRLSTKLNVCGLPGGGFSGDWFLGIAKGSVSVDLGLKIIKILSSQEEEYLRLSMGIGLPIHEKFYKDDKRKLKFYAWPRGTHVGLNAIYNIYNKALSRKEIYDYDKIRGLLTNVAKQLYPEDEDQSEVIKKDRYEMINRIFPQIKHLQKE
jgi:KaiC/GvpD/RAD55 family RecA-like ATPase